MMIDDESKSNKDFPLKPQDKTFDSVLCILPCGDFKGGNVIGTSPH